MTYTPIYKVSLVRDSSIRTEDRPSLTTPLSVVRMLREMVKDTDREQFMVIMLDARNRVIGVNVASVGTVSATLVHPREVFKPAIVANAVGIIVAHNHPSGSSDPSPEDRQTTRRLVDAGRTLGIPVVDHLIVSDESFVSFRDEGWME